MFESIKGINYVTRMWIICSLKTIRQNPSYVFSEMDRYSAYISALRDMKIISASEKSFLWEVGHYMQYKYSFHWNRKQLREHIR